MDHHAGDDDDLQPYHSASAPTSATATAAATATALFQLPSDRLNHQRDSTISVHDKVARFDSLAFQGKLLERKTNDAALKRAMLGREEAEGEMRRYRDEARTLRRLVEEGGARERKVGERLESVMEKYAQTKETHAHTQALWEKEIRKARKETFKAQSVTVKLQEELNVARQGVKAFDSELELEKERSVKREQEAFEARYQLVGVQEELVKMQEKIKLVEQERDALRTVAKNEEVARIAAEGRIPLPECRDGDDEFASPRKVLRGLSAIDVGCSATSETEIEDLKWQVRIERQLARRAQDLADFMQMECSFSCCSCRQMEKNSHRFVTVNAANEDQETAQLLDEESQRQAHEDPSKPLADVDARAMSCWKEDVSNDTRKEVENDIVSMAKGIAESVHGLNYAEDIPVETDAKPAQCLPLESRDLRSAEHPQLESSQEDHHSLLSLIDGSTNTQQRPSIASRPSSPSPDSTLPDEQHEHSPLHVAENTAHGFQYQTVSRDATPTTTSGNKSHSNTNSDNTSVVSESNNNNSCHNTYHTISRTTRVPLSEPVESNSSSGGGSTTPETLHQPQHPFPLTSQTTLLQRPLSTSNLTDFTDPAALTPTMTREEALAQIRERRGRARSLAQGTLTPRKQMMGEGPISARRDISAPAVRSVSRGRNLVRV